jgi:hypothetical protein
MNPTTTKNGTVNQLPNSAHAERGLFNSCSIISLRERAGICAADSAGAIFVMVSR